jgi:hypothetical protein
VLLEAIPRRSGHASHVTKNAEPQNHICRAGRAAERRLSFRRLAPDYAPRALASFVLPPVRVCAGALSVGGQSAQGGPHLLAHGERRNRQQRLRCRESSGSRRVGAKPGGEAALYRREMSGPARSQSSPARSCSTSSFGEARFPANGASTPTQST